MPIISNLDATLREQVREIVGMVRIKALRPDTATERILNILKEQPRGR